MTDGYHAGQPGAMLHSRRIDMPPNLAPLISAFLLSWTREPRCALVDLIFVLAALVTIVSAWQLGGRQWRRSMADKLRPLLKHRRATDFVTTRNGFCVISSGPWRINPTMRCVQSTRTNKQNGRFHRGLRIGGAR